MTEAVIVKLMDWFLYDNGLRHERVNYHLLTVHIELPFYQNQKKSWK